MPFPHPTSFPNLSRREYQVSRPIQVVDFEDLFKANHYLFRFMGRRLGCYTFDPPFTRPDSGTNSSYSQSDSSGNFDLSELTLVSKFVRYLENSGEDMFIEYAFDVHGVNVDVSVEAIRHEYGGGTTSLGSFSGTTDNQTWDTSTVLAQFATSRQNGNSSNPPAVIELKPSVRSTDSSNQAEVNQLSIYESLISSSSYYPRSLDQP